MFQRGILGPKEVPILVGALLILLAPLPHYRSGGLTKFYASLSISFHVMTLILASSFSISIFKSYRSGSKAYIILYFTIPGIFLLLRL